MIDVSEDPINSSTIENKEDDEVEYEDDNDDDTTVIEWASSSDEEDIEYDDEDNEDENRSEETDNQLEQKLDFLERIWSNQKVSSSVAASEAHPRGQQRDEDYEEDEEENLDWAAESDDEEETEQQEFVQDNEDGTSNSLTMPTIMEETDSVCSAFTDLAGEKEDEDDDSTVAETPPPLSPSSIASRSSTASSTTGEYAKDELIVPFPERDAYSYKATPSIYYCRHLLLAEIRQYHLTKVSENKPPSPTRSKKTWQKIQEQSLSSFSSIPFSSSLRNLFSKNEEDSNSNTSGKKQFSPRRLSLRHRNWKSPTTSPTTATQFPLLKSFSR